MTYPTQGLSGVLQGGSEDRITAIGQYIEHHAAEQWETVFDQNREKLQLAYEEVGDPAYGTYLNLLLLPVNRELKEAGLRAEPRLPGDLEISREWGSNPEGSDQQRWMWSTLYAQDGEAVGTIVTIVYHDHTQLRVPRAPKIIALAETTKEAIVEALSARSSDFKQALEFRIEYAAYMDAQQD